MRGASLLPRVLLTLHFTLVSVDLTTSNTASSVGSSSNSSAKTPRKSSLWQGSLLFSSSSHKANDDVPPLVNASTHIESEPESGMSAAINESLTASHSGLKESVYEGIYETLGAGAGESEDARSERLKQLNSWLSERDFLAPSGHRLALATGELLPSQSTMQVTHTEALKSNFPFNPILQPVFTLNSKSNGGKKVVTSETKKSPLTLVDEESRPEEDHHRNSYEDDLHSHKDHPVYHHDDPLPHEDDGHSGQLKAPPCGSHGRFYCTYKEDYPSKIVSEVSKYYKWPLEKLFRDLRQQVMPKLANDNHGGLVCDSITRVVRPGWARNTNNRWLVVINTDHYQQFVTEVICRNGANAPCNYVPPCYQASCVQRYNTQKLMVIDPWNPYKGERGNIYQSLPLLLHQTYARQ